MSSDDNRPRATWPHVRDIDLQQIGWDAVKSFAGTTEEETENVFSSANFSCAFEEYFGLKEPLDGGIVSGFLDERPWVKQRTLGFWKMITRTVQPPPTKEEEAFMDDLFPDDATVPEPIRPLAELAAKVHGMQEDQARRNRGFDQQLGNLGSASSVQARRLKLVFARLGDLDEEDAAEADVVSEDSGLVGSEFYVSRNVPIDKIEQCHKGTYLFLANELCKVLDYQGFPTFDELLALMRKREEERKFLGNDNATKKRRLDELQGSVAMLAENVGLSTDWEG